MNVKVTTWKVSTLIGKLDKIDDQPVYQRGKVWSRKKDALLIDSMLRGIDIPKIYLRELNNSSFDYEVADGQQRINAIHKFQENDFKLLNTSRKGLDLSQLNGNHIGNCTYKELPEEIKEIFDGYDLTIAIISSASGKEIRTLFGRLQEGERLNPAEKRNAIISDVRNHVQSLALNHSFFEDSRISKRRFKRQDYIAHVLTLIAYGNKDHLKANLIMDLYLDEEFKVDQNMLRYISEVLDIMDDIDSNSNTRIYKKYHFIDVFWFLYRHLNDFSAIDTKKFAKDFDSLEKDRLDVKEPRKILEEGNLTEDKKMFYDYVLSFKYSGSLSENIDKRAQYMDKYFKKYIN